MSLVLLFLLIFYVMDHFIYSSRTHRIIIIFQTRLLYFPFQGCVEIIALFICSNDKM